MPSVFLIAAGYAAYTQYEKRKSAKYDDSINLDGKSSITLMPPEQDLGVLQFPIATMTFFNGCYRNTVPFLEKRVDEILQANPWLAGWLIRDLNDDYNVKIFFDATGADRCQGKHFEVFEDVAAIPLSQAENEMREYEGMLSERGVTVPFNDELLGHNRPLWKVSIVPCRDRAEEQFALVVSMSHAVGDGHTYYQLFNMLDKEARVEALDPVREPDYSNKLVDMVGPKDVNYFSRAVTSQLVRLAGSLDDRLVSKKFYVDEDWALEKKSNRESIFTPSKGTGNRIATVVSLNSIVTSWFFNINQASIGLMAVNLRHRMDNCPLDDKKAGNYVHPLVYTPVDYRTAGLVQESLIHLHRCGCDTPEELPNVGWNTNLSFSNDWSRFFRDELYLHDDVSTTLHSPFFHLKLMKDLPNRFSTLHLFTAHPRGIDGSEHRLGASVLCRKSVWRKIQESGIVEEVM